MKKKFLSLLILGAGLMSSCGKQIPDDIIQPAEMEDLLYDYHFAVSLGTDLPDMNNHKREALKKHVFEKHNVTRAEFDSSMVWYTRHANFLYDIYSQLDKRYMMAESRMKTLINKRSGQIEVSLSGDSVDVWSDRDIYWLSTSKLTNKVTFNLKADTTFRPFDVLALEANFTFFSSDSVPSTSRAIVGLNIHLKNDSTQSLIASVDTTGYQRFCLQSPYEGEFDNVTGFIYCTTPDSTKGEVLVSGIRLMRYHDKNDDGKSTDKPAGDVRVSDRKTRGLSVVKMEEAQ